MPFWKALNSFLWGSICTYFTQQYGKLPYRHQKLRRFVLFCVAELDLSHVLHVKISILLVFVQIHAGCKTSIDTALNNARISALTVHNYSGLILSLSKFIDRATSINTTVVFGWVQNVQCGEAVMQRLFAAVIWNILYDYRNPLQYLKDFTVLFMSSLPFRYHTTTRFWSLSGVSLASRWIGCPSNSSCDRRSEWKLGRSEKGMKIDDVIRLVTVRNCRIHEEIKSH